MVSLDEVPDLILHCDFHEVILMHARMADTSPSLLVTEYVRPRLLAIEERVNFLPLLIFVEPFGLNDCRISSPGVKLLIVAIALFLIA